MNWEFSCLHMLPFPHRRWFPAALSSAVKTVVRITAQFHCFNVNRPGTIHLSSEIAERFERTAEETAADCRNRGDKFTLN